MHNMPATCLQRACNVRVTCLCLKQPYHNGKPDEMEPVEAFVVVKLREKATPKLCTYPKGKESQSDLLVLLEWASQTTIRMVGLLHGGGVSLLLYATPPPPVEVGQRPPGGRRAGHWRGFREGQWGGGSKWAIWGGGRGLAQGWAQHHPPNFIHGCFCHIIALHFGPQYSL